MNKYQLRKMQKEIQALQKDVRELQSERSFPFALEGVASDEAEEEMIGDFIDGLGKVMNDHDLEDIMNESLPPYPWDDGVKKENNE